jgi:hypothetical protein
MIANNADIEGQAWYGRTTKSDDKIARSCENGPD